jgi:hypothetical protein
MTDFDKIHLCLHRWRIPSTVTTPPREEWIVDGPEPLAEPLWALWTIGGESLEDHDAHGELRWVRHTPYMLEWRRDSLDEIADEMIPLRRLDTWCAGCVMELARKDTVKT